MLKTPRSTLSELESILDRDSFRLSRKSPGNVAMWILKLFCVVFILKSKARDEDILK